jgi:hypothetical protein
MFPEDWEKAPETPVLPREVASPPGRSSPGARSGDAETLVDSTRGVDVCEKAVPVETTKSPARSP